MSNWENRNRGSRARGRFDGGSEDGHDFSYKGKSRDRNHNERRSKADNQHGEHDIDTARLPKRERARTSTGKVIGVSAKVAAVRANAPVKKRLDSIFEPSPDADALLAFLQDPQVKSGSPVPFVATLSRLEKELRISNPATKATFISLTPALYELFNHLVTAKDMGPREISTSLRCLGKIYTTAKKLASLNQEKFFNQVQEDLERFQGGLAALWSKALTLKDKRMKSADCIAAAVGMTLNDYSFRVKSPQGNKKFEAMQICLRDTCERLYELLSEDKDPPIRPLTALLRHFAMDSFRSEKLLRISQKLLLKGDSACEATLKEASGPGFSPLAIKLVALFACSTSGVKDLNALASAEKELLSLSKAAGQKVISADMIADFLCASIAHDYTPSTKLLDTLEVLLPDAFSRMYADPFTRARAAYFSTLSLSLLKDTVLDSTRELASRVPTLTSEKKSKVTNDLRGTLESICKELNLKLETGTTRGPCRLSFLIHGQEKKLSIELAGSAFQQVFEIDNALENRSTDLGPLPFKAMLRARYLAEKEGIVTIRVDSRQAKHADPRTVRGLLKSDILDALRLERENR